MENIKEKILELKKEKNALILAHYYVPGDVQDIADEVGDSFALAKKAKETDADIIVFCGVHFMAESAKLLNPRKKVLLPDMSAGCTMADMVTKDDILKLKAKYPKAKVCTYVNSTADVKTVSDVCVTSSNAVKIVQNIDSDEVIFVPDQNLGRFVATQVPDKHVILHHGYCITHHQISLETLNKAKQDYPGYLVVTHPECQKDVVEASDYVGSTLQIINYITQSSHDAFLVCTEQGVLHEIQKQNPSKTIKLLSEKLNCPNMKKITLEKVYDVLKYENNEVIFDEDFIEKARRPLDKMLKLG